MIRSIIFDFDGTLADTASGIIATTRETFRRLGFPIPDETKIRKGIGLVLHGSMKVAGDLDDETADRAAVVYRSIFNEYGTKEVTLFPGVRETLQHFADKGITMAIATSRGSESLEMLMSPFGIEKYFSGRVTASDNIAPKPAPDLVLALLDRMKLDPESTLVVGDTAFDIMMGSGAGCHTCAVTYGNHSREQLAETSPEYIIDDFAKLTEIVG